MSESTLKNLSVSLITALILFGGPHVALADDVVSASKGLSLPASEGQVGQVLALHKPYILNRPHHTAFDVSGSKDTEAHLLMDTQVNPLGGDNGQEAIGIGLLVLVVCLSAVAAVTLE